MLLNTADHVYLGTTPVDAVYLGTTKVWPPIPPMTWRYSSTPRYAQTHRGYVAPWSAGGDLDVSETDASGRTITLSQMPPDGVLRMIRVSDHKLVALMVTSLYLDTRGTRYFNYSTSQQHPWDVFTDGDLITLAGM
jgi:hypothetical protein